MNLRNYKVISCSLHLVLSPAAEINSQTPSALDHKIYPSNHICPRSFPPTHAGAPLCHNPYQLTPVQKFDSRPTIALCAPKGSRNLSSQLFCTRLQMYFRLSYRIKLALMRAAVTATQLLLAPFLVVSNTHLSRNHQTISNATQLEMGRISSVHSVRAS